MRYDKVIAGKEVSIIELPPKIYWACLNGDKEIGGDATDWDTVEKQVQTALKAPVKYRGIEIKYDYSPLVFSWWAAIGNSEYGQSFRMKDLKGKDPESIIIERAKRYIDEILKKED